ncbi:MAG: hypothetical protein ACLFSQ_06480 [Candidatus Zixiibacteriota bacterium]
MGHVYTPGLKVTEYSRIRKQRLLPLKGKVTVKVGDKVRPDTVIAETFLPGDVQPINVANKLGCDADSLDYYMKKKVGDEFKKDEIYAENKGLFGLFKTSLRAPFDGTIESISDITGQVILRAEPIPLQIKAFIDGEIIEVIPEEGAIVETFGSFIQGIFGIGGERFGDLVVLAESHDTYIKAEQINEKHRGKIIVAGSVVTADVFNKANSLGVKGIIGGGIDAFDLRKVLGYDIGVAITGSEDVTTTLVVTEGFGEIPMAKQTFDLLKKNDGNETSMHGATQIRAGVIRPEIVITKPKKKDFKDTGEELIGLEIGSTVRVIRVPYFGQIGKVTELPSELRKLGSESMARVLGIEFDNGERAIVPRANVEMIESA